jgi:hypothetical protein
MPIFNHLVLKLIKRRFNVVRDAGVKGAGSWAGIKIVPGCPYWDVWEYYRRN